MRPKTFLVTGCMGFIGSNFVPKLLQRYVRVIGIDNLSNASLHPTDRMKREAGPKFWPAFTFYNLDVTDFETLATVLQSFKIDGIIHLAALGSVPRSFENPIATIKNNDLGFVSVMQLAAALKIPKVVYASSSSVYGDSKDVAKIEGREGMALSPYALSKQMNEQFAFVWGEKAGVKSVGLRFFNVFGPGQRPDSPYSAAIPRFINDPSPVIYGDGLQMRDFTFVDDVCEAILNALVYNGPSTCVNVGKGFGNTVNEIVKMIGVENKVSYLPARTGDIRISVADTTRAQKVLGFEAKTPIELGIEKTKQYYWSLANETK